VDILEPNAADQTPDVELSKKSHGQEGASLESEESPASAAPVGDGPAVELDKPDSGVDAEGGELTTEYGTTEYGTTEYGTTEYGTDLAAEATEALDADEIHREHDAEEGGDYTDYAGFEEDDDDRFGEALPEDLGGPSPGLEDSQHEVLLNIHAAPITDIGEREAIEAAAEGTPALNVTTPDSMFVISLWLRSYLTIHVLQLLTHQEETPPRSSEAPRPRTTVRTFYFVSHFLSVTDLIK
jgi:hypothetical protein